MGGSMSGSSRTGSRDRPITPKRMSARLIMVARTGRWMLMRGRIMVWLFVIEAGIHWRSRESARVGSGTGVRPGRLRRREFDLGSSPDFLDALDYNRFSCFQAAHHLHLPGEAQTEPDRPGLHGAVRVHHENDRALAVQELAQGDFGNDDRVLPDVHRQIEVGKHAGLESVIRIG